MDWLFFCIGCTYLIILTLAQPWPKSLTIFPILHPLINLNKIITPKTTRSTTQKSSQFCQNLQTNRLKIDSALESAKFTNSKATTPKL